MHNKPRIHRLSPLAVSDLEGIWLYTFQQWSLEQADAYVSNIIAVFSRLTRGEAIGQPVSERTGYWKYRVKQHMIYFRQSDVSVDVIRILHVRMDADIHLMEQTEA